MSDEFKTVMDTMTRRFTSGNSLEVERTTIMRGEWEAVVWRLAELAEEIEIYKPDLMLPEWYHNPGTRRLILEDEVERLQGNNAVMDKQIAELQADLTIVKLHEEELLEENRAFIAERDGYARNAAYYKCFALSGEVPPKDSDPYRPPQEQTNG